MNIQVLYFLPFLFEFEQWFQFTVFNSLISLYRGQKWSMAFRLLKHLFLKCGFCLFLYYFKKGKSQAFWGEWVIDWDFWIVTGFKFEWSCFGWVLCTLVWSLSSFNTYMGEGSQCLERSCYCGSPWCWCSQVPCSGLRSSKSIKHTFPLNLR